MEVVGRAQSTIGNPTGMDGSGPPPQQNQQHQNGPPQQFQQQQNNYGNNGGGGNNYGNNNGGNWNGNQQQNNFGNSLQHNNQGGGYGGGQLGYGGGGGGGNYGGGGMGGPQHGGNNNGGYGQQGGGGGYGQNLQPSYQGSGPVVRNEMPGKVTLLEALNPYQNRWTIKVRVNSKSDRRRFTNARGDGQLFSFDIQDEARPTRLRAGRLPVVPLLTHEKAAGSRRGCLCSPNVAGPMPFAPLKVFRGRYVAPLRPGRR